MSSPSNSAHCTTAFRAKVKSFTVIQDLLCSPPAPYLLDLISCYFPVNHSTQLPGPAYSLSSVPLTCSPDVHGSLLPFFRSVPQCQPIREACLTTLYQKAIASPSHLPTCHMGWGGCASRTVVLKCGPWPAAAAAGNCMGNINSRAFLWTH